MDDSGKSQPADRIISTECLYEGWLSFILATARMAGERVKRPIVVHPSGSTVLAYDPERRVAFTVTQTRLPVLYLGEEPLPEAVAGVGGDEEPWQTARRESLEEIGVALGELVEVGHVWMTPSTTTERVHLFLGEYRSSDRVATGGGAAGELEELVVKEQPLSELWLRAVSGAVTDGKLFMLLQALRIRRPELFDSRLDWTHEV